MTGPDYRERRESVLLDVAGAENMRDLPAVCDQRIGN